MLHQTPLHEEEGGGSEEREALAILVAPLISLCSSSYYCKLWYRPKKQVISLVIIELWSKRSVGESQSVLLYANHLI